MSKVYTFFLFLEFPKFLEFAKFKKFAKFAKFAQRVFAIGDATWRRHMYVVVDRRNASPDVRVKHLPPRKRPCVGQ